MKIVILALAAVAQSQAPQQFDLICVSKYHDAIFHYRVDLETSRYCVTQDQGKRYTAIGDQCFQDIMDVGSNALSFGVDPVQYVDRQTGQWSLRPFDHPYTMYHGTCTPAPFSGFPQVNTKF